MRAFSVFNHFPQGEGGEVETARCSPKTRWALDGPAWLRVSPGKVEEPEAGPTCGRVKNLQKVMKGGWDLHTATRTSKTFQMTCLVAATMCWYFVSTAAACITPPVHGVTVSPSIQV